ncbi:MAG: hypothetical protein ABJG78_01895 [Cyclobacteriaceae bacterium]
MEKLKHDWLTEGLIDFEYKKYILLAYLKDIRGRFDMNELYPFMSDLVFHYRNILKVKESKKLMYENFPESLSRADFEKLQLVYEKVVKDGEVMQALDDIINYALPKIQATLDDGKEIYEFVEENIEIIPVGLSAIYEKEGYLLINQDNASDVSVYRYEITLFEHAEEKYRSMTTEFLMNDIKNISRTFEKIKVDLTKRFTELPNPATYLALSRLKFPLNETLLPVAKRMLVRTISV